jgi:hypothetical protein
MEQATVNLFADMGVQPTTLISGLTAATQSANTTPPSSTITSPSGGANFNDGTSTTITGTASSAKGVVAGVEVSTDGGNSWHPATITTPDGPTVNWSYNWVAQGNPSTTIMSRATDDSGNIETPSAGVSVNVSCPCSLWGSATPAGAPDSGDASAVTVGMKFTSDQYGTINAIRFYKPSTDTGTHIGSLWTANGQLLESVTFTNETTSGWQQANLATPVTIQPNTTYVVSYFAPKGHYADTNDYFYRAPSPTPIGGGTLNNPPLHAVMNNTSANGVFTYGSTNQFPTNTYSATNYWVDVQFTPGSPSVPGAPSGVSASPAGSQALVSWTDPSNGGSAITSYSITPTQTAPGGATTTLSPVSVSGASVSSAVVSGLTNGDSYTFTVSATNGVGTGAASSPSGSVVPEDTIFDFSTTPATVDSGDTSSLNLGVQFTASQSGSVTGIRFYKASANTGTHIGDLWSSSGGLLAQGTFTGETASGWQTLVFSSPVAVTAGTTYVASYFAPNGHYSVTSQGFSSAVTNGPLTASANGSTTPGNGVYAYGSGPGFPNNTYKVSNYWVDVLFAP